MVGGVALLAAAFGAATAGHAISSGETTATTAQTHGGYVADLSSAALAGRDATQISRSAARPIVSAGGSAGSASPARQVGSAGAGAALANAAEKRAAARDDLLRSAANEAEEYAEELSNQWVLPTSGFHISTWFGESGPYWASGYHTGIDFATAYGTPVVAVATGTITQTGWDGPYGNQVRMRLENGDEVWYNHLSAIDVVVGQGVAQGQQLGRVGETGNAYGAHLHFEYRLAANLHDGVDPRPFFAEHGLSI